MIIQDIRVYIYMLRIAGQTAGAIGLNFEHSLVAGNVKG